MNSAVKIAELFLKIAEFFLKTTERLASKSEQKCFDQNPGYFSTKISVRLFGLAIAEQGWSTTPHFDRSARYPNN